MTRPEVSTLAAELIEVKKQIKKLLEQEKKLKEIIKPFIKEEGSVILDEGKIYYSESKGASTFSRKEVIQYLRDSYGDTLAEQIDQDCTKVGSPRQTVYIKLKNNS